MTNLTLESMDERAQYFLKAVAERYIRDGMPVGSRTLAKETDSGLSPATIRNIMADLEAMGLLSSPHTSAGRIPTASGLRMFINSLITLSPVAQQDLAEIEAELARRTASDELVASASGLLANLTHLAGLVTIPRRESRVYRQIEFLPLSERRILAILVTRDGHVFNKILHPDKAFERSQLEEAANYLNSLFENLDLSQVRSRLLAEIRQARNNMQDHLSKALSMADQVVSSSEQDDFIVSGQTNLMLFSELSNMNRLRELFDAFIEKSRILGLLDQCLDAEGVQIFVGEDSGYQLLDDCSLVTSPYRVNDQVIGVLGVIGPTRMPYDRVIPVVDLTARLLSSAMARNDIF